MTHKVRSLKAADSHSKRSSLRHKRKGNPRIPKGKAALDELASEAQKLGLYDESPTADTGQKP